MSAVSDVREPQLPKEHYLNADYGVRSWLLTIDHKRIAILYLLASRSCSSSAALFAVAIRLELVTPPGDLISSETYNSSSPCTAS